MEEGCILIHTMKNALWKQMREDTLLIEENCTTNGRGVGPWEVESGEDISGMKSSLSAEIEWFKNTNRAWGVAKDPLSGPSDEQNEKPHLGREVEHS